MPCEMVAKEIDGRRVTVMQMDPVAALKLEARLMPAVAQSIVPVLGILLKTDEPEAVFLSRSIREVFTALPPEVLAETMIELLSSPNLSIDGERVQFERDFAGAANVAFRYKVFAFVLEANYADFFDSLAPKGAVMERARTLFASKMEGPTSEAAGSSTGGSGDPA